MLWITGIKLPAFGRFQGAEFSFKPGMNLIYGRNEAGKSTILSAIAGVIFGFRKDKDRYVPWDGGERYEAQVSFAYDDREMCIARDFATDRVQVVERHEGVVVWRFEGKVSAGGRSSEREEYLRKIEEVWGFAEGDIFRNSVYVGQRDLKIEGEGGLNTKIKQLLSGFAEMDYDAVADSLEKELFGLTKRPGGRSKDRELEDVRTRIAELGIAWKEANRALGEIRNAEAELAELRKFIEAGRTDLEKGEKYLQRVRKYHEAAAREEAVRKEFDRVQADREKVEALQARKADIGERLAPLADIASLPDGFALLIRSYLSACEKLAQLEDELAVLGEAPMVERRAISVPLLAVTLLVWAGTVWAWFAFRMALYPLVVFALILTGFVIVRVMKGKQSINAEYSRRQGRVDGIEEEISRLRAEVKGYECDISAHLGAFDPVNASGVLQDMERVEKIRGEQAQVESALRVLPEIDGLVAKGAELARELAVLRETMDGVVGKGFPVISHEEFVAAEEKMRRLEGEVKEKERLCLLKEQDMAVLRRGMLDLEAIEEEGDELRNREARLVRRVGALRLAIDLLRETLDEYRSTYLARFGTEINGKLYNMTAGRYREVALDDGFNLSIGCVGKLRNVESYSCGVQDQAYLASRLALGGILSHGRKLPFLLDDPLVNFDDERKTAALTALNLMAAVHQVLLFVHDERYLKLKGADGWNKIRLDVKRGQDGQLHLL